jgi:hypothetical protein
MTVINRVLPDLQIIDGEQSVLLCLLMSLFDCCFTDNMIQFTGGHQMINDSFRTMEQHMDSLQPDSRACKTPPLDFWITEKDIALLSKDSSGTDVDSLIDQSKAYSAVRDVSNKINDMLNEECSHLLRKAQSAITKNSKV